VTRATLALLISIGVFAVGMVRAQVIGAPSRAVIAPLPPAAAGDARRIALGRDLFADRRLSRSQRLSCASCHDLATNGASGAVADRGDTGARMRFNTPTVFNTAHLFRLGWEGRTRSLEELSFSALRSAQLMHGATYASARLRGDRAIAGRFRAIYGAPPGDANIADALAAFMATLVTPDAPFDRWLRGDRTALTAQQQRGYERFQVLGCASCHQGVNVGANLFQRRGIFHPLGAARPSHLRVPSLRNVAVTAPYFHDGSEASLPTAIRRMARAQLDLTIDDRDVDDIAAFLDTLTGTYRGRPLRPAAPAQ
jgi:cytochrome c peroxidase